MQATTLQCQFDWDEPEGCSSPRGWLGLLNHPDIPEPDNHYKSRCVGFYLDYAPGDTKGPAGETILASAYIRRYQPLLPQREIRLGHGWYFTIAEAKAWIERALQLYFDTAQE